MKILQVTSPCEFEILDVPVPEPGPDEVLMRITAVTTCPQWDLHLRHNEPMFVGHAFHYPFTPGKPGHEAVGRIEAVGEGVAGLKAGDRVCAWRDTGEGHQGCYAQYVAIDAARVIRVPGELPDEALAPLELAMCVGACFRMLRDMDAILGRCFGVQREDYTFSPQHYRGLRLCGYKGHSRESAEYALDLIRRGKLDLAALVTHKLPLERYAEGVNLLENLQAVKVCFLPWEE